MTAICDWLRFSFANVRGVRDHVIRLIGFTKRIVKSHASPIINKSRPFTNPQHDKLRVIIKCSVLQTNPHTVWTYRLAQQDNLTDTEDDYKFEMPQSETKRTRRKRNSRQKADARPKKRSADEDTSDQTMDCPWIRTPVVYPTALTFLDYVPSVRSESCTTRLSDRDKKRLDG